MLGTHKAVCIVAILAVVSTISCRRTESRPGGATQASKIDRGRHLVTVSGCGDCHTPGGMYGGPDAARTLAGSELGWRGPWGVSYPPNLTPDHETGLGRWSEDDIVRAIRTGVRPDGRVIPPPMPWPGFAAFSDEDAYSIAAYLKSLPAVKHKSPATLPPGVEPTGPVVTIPPPPAWDAPRGGVGGGPPH